MPSLLVINPNTTQAMTDDIGRGARAAAGPDTVIECIKPASGPRSIEGFTDEVLAAYNLVDTVAAARGKYDGIIVACYGDPAVSACRERDSDSRSRPKTPRRCSSVSLSGCPSPSSSPQDRATTRNGSGGL